MSGHKMPNHIISLPDFDNLKAVIPEIPLDMPLPSLR